MKMQFAEDKDFEEFKNTIRTNLSGREKRILDFPDYRKASVLILFMNKENSPHVLLTLRTDKVSTHTRQISFPGGSYDDTDRDFLDTALRETQEEMGIDPADIEVLGEFDEYISIMGFQVYAYVGAAEYPIQYDLSKDEIDEVLEVPFSLFYNEEYDKCEKITHEGRDYDVYFYKYRENTIWGMTARMLTDFARKTCKQV